MSDEDANLFISDSSGGTSLPSLPEELPQHWQGQPELTGAAERLRLAHCFLDHWIDLATEHYSELTAMQLIVRMNDAVCNAFGHNYDPLKEGCFTQEMRAKLKDAEGGNGRGV